MPTTDDWAWDDAVIRPAPLNDAYQKIRPECIPSTRRLRHGGLVRGKHAEIWLGKLIVYPTFIIQTADSVISNAHQLIEARLARWLLMCHDRNDGDEIALTREFMAMMIAADRSSVTISLHVLEGVGMIRSKHGSVLILDREKLEELAGEGYGRPEAEYRKLIAPFGKNGPRVWAAA